MLRLRHLGLSALLLLAACGPDTVSFQGPAFPTAGVAASGDILIVPDSDWHRHPERSVWSFRGRGRVYVEVLGPSLHPLQVYLGADDADAGKLFRVSWDGETLIDEVEVARDGATELEIEVPRDRLQSGRHVLEIRRIYRRGAGRGHDNTFSSFGYRLGGNDAPFHFEQVARYEYIAAFLGRGVAGLDRPAPTGQGGSVRRDGLLMLGRANAEVTVETAGRGHLQMVLENVSDQHVFFDLRPDGGTVHRIGVDARDERDLRIPLPAGRSTLELSVDDATDTGVYLWGEPSVTLREPEVEAEIGDEPPAPIFLITLDTTRKDALGVYGGDAELTPHLQRFARTATVFDNAHSTSPWTLPSHASIFTGLYPSHHTAGVAETQLPSTGKTAVPTIASRLRAAGYLTAGFAGGRMVHHDYGVGRGFAHYRDPDGFETLGDRLTDYVEEHLRRNSPLDRTRGLFVFANYFDPHALYLAPREFRQRAGVGQHRQALDGHPIWQTFDRAEQGATAAWRQMIDGEAAVTPELLAYLRAAYHSEIAFLDHQLGRLFEVLRDLELYERSMIILVADHGELLGEYGGLFSHAGRLDPELTEIPLLIKWPGQTEGRRVDALVSQVDLYATILEAAGLEVVGQEPGVNAAEAQTENRARVETHPSDGRSLAPLVLGQASGDWDARRYLFLEEHESRIHPLPERLRLGSHVYGLQRPRFRQLVWRRGKGNDGVPTGACARILDERPEKVWRDEPCDARPEAVLQRIERTLGVAAQVEAAGVVSAEDEAALKALGYL